MIHFLKSSKSDRVNAVSPWTGLKIMPLAMSWLRMGATVAFTCRSR